MNAKKPAKSSKARPQAQSKQAQLQSQLQARPQAQQASQEIARDLYLNRLIDRMHNHLIKVVTGIRRCGKTYLLFTLFTKYLKEELKVKDDHIIEIALDTEENKNLRDPSVLSEYIESRIADTKTQYYVLIDEVQYAISDAELKLSDLGLNRKDAELQTSSAQSNTSTADSTAFSTAPYPNSTNTQPAPDTTPRLYNALNSLLRMSNVDVYVTGSNSKLLSTDVMTQFRGRGDEIRVRPLSFAEFMQGFSGDKYEGWAEYMVYGGMPLALSMRSDEQKSRYLERLFSETYLKDVIARNRVSKTQELEDLVDILASSIGALTNPPKIEATFKSVLKSKISANTIATYINYLEESFLISEAKRYDVKGRKYIGSPKKYYFEDMGLRNARLGFRQVEPTHIMENVIYNELCTRGFNVDIGAIEKVENLRGANARAENARATNASNAKTARAKTSRKQLEVDFVANLGSKRYYIQSAFRMPDVAKENQEKRSLLEIPDSFKKIVLVGDVVKPLYDEHGILTMSIYDFLLDPNSLSF